MARRSGPPRPKHTGRHITSPRRSRRLRSSKSNLPGQVGCGHSTQPGNINMAGLPYRAVLNIPATR